MARENSHRIDLRPSASLGQWLALSVGSLIMSGLLALLLVVGRLPALARFITDPLFFRRCLVVHVDLSLVVWLLSFAAGLTFLLPGSRRSLVSRAGSTLSFGGVGLVLAAAAAPNAEPVLANYLPVIDHWVFGAGLALFGLGVVASLLDRRLLPVESAGEACIVPAAAVPGLRATAIALLLAALTFASSRLVVSPGLETHAFYELTSWGGGHVLQLATTAAMLSVWLILLEPLLGDAPLSRRAASTVFGLLVLPWLSAPLLPLLLDEVTARAAFTELMRWGLFPAATVVFACSVRALARAFSTRRLTRASWSDPRFTGFVASSGLCVLGYVLGSLIRGSNTIIPAHYHAAIGAVTASFMAVTYPLLERLGLELGRGRARRRLIALQPLLFAGGQAVFALGFAVAGAHGTGRKVYGAEQHVASAAQEIGLVVMAVGGLCAIAGGVLYLTLVVTAWARRNRAIPIYSSLAAARPEETHG